MANLGTPNTNTSQFFITLDRTEELQDKHTIFGSVIGDTIYNVMKLGEVEIGKNERPVHPPVIKNVEVIDNPFPDIVPRITSAQRKEQAKARKEAKKEKQKEKMLAKHKALAKLRVISTRCFTSHPSFYSFCKPAHTQAYGDP